VKGRRRCTDFVQVLSLPLLIAPTKVLIVPLSARLEFDPLVLEVCKFRLRFVLTVSDSYFGVKLRDCAVLGFFLVLMTRTRLLVNGTPEMMNLGRRMVSRLILHVRVEFFFYFWTNSSKKSCAKWYDDPSVNFPWYVIAHFGD